MAPGIGIGIGIGRGGGGTNWSSYWTTHTDDLDFWSDGIEADGLSLTNKVGTGGALKQFKAFKGDAPVTDTMGAQDDTFLMLDETAIYEFYLECIFNPAASAHTLSLMTSNLLNGGGGWRLMQDGTGSGYYMQINSDGSAETQNKSALNVFVNGLNRINVKFDIPNKEVAITVNGDVFTYTHGKATVFDVSGHWFTLSIGSEVKEQQNVYFKMIKNNVVIKEFICGEVYHLAGSANESSLDLYSGKAIAESYAGGEICYQDLSNPYVNGYDLYWCEDTLRYRNICPINKAGNSINPRIFHEYTLLETDYSLFKRILPTELGYHILNYVEMPDIPIFDTTSRTHWKVSIEADPYYVGGTAGKERWFHKTWLDFDWIDTHIEDAYTGLFIVQCRWKKALGQSYVKIKIENIVLLKVPVSHFNVRTDFYETENMGGIYESVPAIDNSKILHESWSNGDKCVGRDGDYLRYSEDAGLTILRSFDFSTIYPVANISYLKVTDNGNILIFSNNKLVHYSDDGLATVASASVVNADNSPFVFHNPVDSNYPGSYFKLLNSCIEHDGVIVIGSYANSGQGASPVILFYSIDDGITWKVFYTYGQNPLYTDDGSDMGGIGGNLLGDAANPILTTRIEGINIGYDGNIYVGSEGGTIGANCNSMMKCVYNSGTDSWVVTSLIDATSRTRARMRCNGLYEKDGYIYWVSSDIVDDVINGITYPSLGIFKCLAEDIDDFSKHITVSVASAELTNGCGAFVSNPNNGKVIASWYSEIHLSKDYGETWEVFQNKFNNSLLPILNDLPNDCWTGGGGQVKVQITK